MIKKTRLLWNMPITIQIESTDESLFEEIFVYFNHIDEVFSVFRSDSEISKINSGKKKIESASSELKEVLQICQKTKDQTDGFFDVSFDGKINPTGIVKGWAVFQASKKLLEKGLTDFYIEAGGDIQVARSNSSSPWKVGIRNPFKHEDNVKIVRLFDQGIATSGTYIRGNHIINPKVPGKANEFVSLTVIGPNVLEADRLSTPAFVMGISGLEMIEKMDGFEAYAIDQNGLATYTSGFNKYIVE